MHVKVRSFNKMLNGLKREIEKRLQILPGIKLINVVQV